MKSVSIKRFYSDASLMEALPEGEHIAVTSRGKTKFIVTKFGRPRMTSEIASQRAVGTGRGSKFDGVAFLKSLKK